MTSTHEPAGDDADDSEGGVPEPEARPTRAGSPRQGPYPDLLHYQLMTPLAPLPPGAGVRVIPLPVHHQVPAQWAADPSGRHHWRWWDGVRWTEHVADEGRASVDPLDG